MSMTTSSHPTTSAPSPEWSALAATLRGVALIAVLGGIAGFFAARFLWM